MSSDPQHPTRALIHLDRLRHNLALLQDIAGGRPLWPAIKANAYGHGAEPITRYLVQNGYDTLCVAHAIEAMALQDAGVDATFVILSAMLPDQADVAVARALEPAISNIETAIALSRAAEAAETGVAVHIKVDTGMGRVGVGADEAGEFVARCQALPGLHVRGLMSHFARADEGDKSSAREQLERYRRIEAIARDHDIEWRHMANSAAILDLPKSHFDAVRPGIAIYGLAPSGEIANARVNDLRPVLEWVSRISHLKEVPAGTGLSYGHAFTTQRPSLIATVPVGYGDGLSRSLSGKFDVLVGGRRCPQVGRITMDQSLVDVTGLRDRVALGDAVTLIGRQGDEEVTAAELAGKLGTISYEIVTAIAHRVPRIAVDGNSGPAR